MKRSDLTLKQIMVVAIAVIFVAALVYVSIFDVEITETLAQQPVALDNVQG